MEIEALELDASGPGRAFGLALVCRAVGCRTGEEDRDGRLVLHVVGPKSVLLILAPLLPRLVEHMPEGPRSLTIGYAVGVAKQLVEHVMIPHGAAEAVEAEFRRRFEVLADQAGEVIEPSTYQAGKLASQEFEVFPNPSHEEGQQHGHAPPLRASWQPWRPGTAV